MTTDTTRNAAPWYHYVLALAVSQAVLQTLLDGTDEVVRVAVTVALLVVVAALVTVAWRAGLTRRRRA